MIATNAAQTKDGRHRCESSIWTKNKQSMIILSIMKNKEKVKSRLKEKLEI